MISPNVQSVDYVDFELLQTSPVPTRLRIAPSRPVQVVTKVLKSKGLILGLAILLLFLIFWDW
jgi:hypothetical protein